MILNELIEDAKMELTGGILDLEIPDTSLVKLSEKVLREIQRYTDETKIMTIPYAPCIDLKDSDVSSISNIFRATSIGVSDKDSEGSDWSAGYKGAYVYDPIYASFWAGFTGGTYRLTDWTYNYGAYSLLNQIQNTVNGADLNYYYDKKENKIYIHVTDKPQYVTIEYIPIYKGVEDIQSSYWQDIFRRLFVAYLKVALGRIRSKFTQTNALWTLDGETLLAEGNAELNDLRVSLGENDQLFYPID